MKITLFPDSDYRTQVPITVIASKTNDTPRLFIERMGEIPFKPVKNNFEATFWVQQEGKYQLKVQDRKEILLKIIIVNEQKYISFGREFGIFLILFFIVIAGVIIWVKQVRNV